MKIHVHEDKRGEEGIYL